MTVKVEVHGLDELRRKFEKFPHVFAAAMKTTLTAVLLKLWDSVPSYPKPPPNSTYKRTGTLGRSLGVGWSGGGHKMGQPGIMRIKRGARNVHSASFGTNLEYAPDVIGDRQTAPFQGRWWTLRGVAVSAEKAIVGLFETMAAALARWLSDDGPEPIEKPSYTVRG